MSCFPFLVNVDRLKGIIIGGGKVATEKVHRLIEFEPDLTVIAPSVSDEILKYQNQITVKERQYVASDLDGADYVIAATGDRNINEKIYSDAKSRHILINVVDMPELCDFIFPSVVRRGKLVVGVSTNGASPQIAIMLKKKIEEMIPDDIEGILDYLGEERIKAKVEILDPNQRREYLVQLANQCLQYEKGKE